MKPERQLLCFKCEHKCELPQRLVKSQVQCSDPPDTQAFVKHDGEAGVRLAREVMEKLKENVVIRVTWLDSGSFPFMFDGRSVLLCSNFEEMKA